MESITELSLLFTPIIYGHYFVKGKRIKQITNFMHYAISTCKIVYKQFKAFTSKEYLIFLHAIYTKLNTTCSNKYAHLIRTSVITSTICILKSPFIHSYL